MPPRGTTASPTSSGARSTRGNRRPWIATRTSAFDKFERARTIRIPFQKGSVDVLIRFQSRPYEYWVMRFTAFPVADGGEFQEIPRWYWYDGPREVLGEAALLDASNRW